MTTAHKHHPVFIGDAFISSAIVANTLLMMWSMYDSEHEHILEPLHMGFLILFTVEVAWRWHKRHITNWLWFDTLVIALSLMPAIGAGVTVLLVARFARVIHTMRHITHLRLAGVAANLINKIK